MKSFRTAVIVLTTLMLAVAATVATAQTYTDLFNFDLTHGGRPVGTLAQGQDGNLYGMTDQGGNACGTYGCGVVFGITPSGAQKRVLYNFNDINFFGHPEAGLTLGTDGNFYGTTLDTIFKITRSGTPTILYTFNTSCTDGCYAYAAPIQGTDRSFYGTTQGNFTPGTAYMITLSGRLRSVDLPGESTAPLLQGTDGNFYGTTHAGGADGLGTVFRISSSGTVTTLYSFCSQSGCSDGSLPAAGLIQATDGNFYGTAPTGGSFGVGVVFKLTPQGSITVLHNFGDPNFPNDGGYPDAGLVQATDGNFYGVTGAGGPADVGVIFQITPAGVYSILYSFDGTHGANPDSTPMQHTSGKIYGLAAGGGHSGWGVVYSFDMGLGPFVSFVMPTGRIGKTVQILGQGLTGTTGVSLNGLPASFTVVSDTYIKATVPAGATTGYVTVTTPTGTLTSNKPFIVMP